MITEQKLNSIEKYGEFTENQFTIAANPKAFRILISNIYSDKVLSILQELGSNSFDSHIAAKNEKTPIKISLPTHFNPTFSIRDFGTSLSHSFMMEKYSVAFLSTKDKSNLYNGEKGLGRLSSLSLCDSFTCVCFLDGEKRTYSVYIAENGIPKIAYLGSEPTNEENGFLVECAVDPSLSSDFQSKAREVFKHYPVKPIFEGFDDFVIYEDKYILEGEDKSWGLKGNNCPSYAIQSVYSYKINVEAISGLDEISKKILQSGLYARFELGELDSNTARDGLDYNTKTINNIKNKIADIIPKIKPSVMAHFENKNTLEKMAIFHSLTGYSGSLVAISDLCREFLKDLKIPSQLNLIKFECHQFTYDQWKSRLKSYQLTSLHYQDNLELIYCPKKTHMKAKARKFLQEPSNNGKKMIFFCPLTTDAIDNFKKEYDIDVSSFINSDTLLFDKPIKNVNPNPKKIRTLAFIGYNRYRRSNNWNEEEMNISDDIIYIQRSGYSINDDSKCRDFYRLADMVTNIKTLTGNDIKVWGLGINQIKKAGKNWKHVKDYYDEELAKFHKQESENIEIFNYHRKYYAGFPQELLDKLDIDKTTLCSKIYQEYEEIKKKVDKIPSELVSQKNHGRISDKYAYNLKMLYENYPIIECLTDNAYLNSTKLKANQKLELSQYINEKKYKLELTPAPK